MQQFFYKGIPLLTKFWINFNAFTKKNGTIFAKILIVEFVYIAKKILKINDFFKRKNFKLRGPSQKE